MQSLSKAVESHFPLIEENFAEIVNCLLKFTKNNFTSFSLKAIDLLSICAKHLGESDSLIETMCKSHAPRFLEIEGRPSHSPSLNRTSNPAPEEEVPFKTSLDLRKAVSDIAI